jgi:hypothetical protein
VRLRTTEGYLSPSGASGSQGGTLPQVDFGVEPGDHATLPEQSGAHQAG